MCLYFPIPNHEPIPPLDSTGPHGLDEPSFQVGQRSSSLVPDIA